MKKTWSEKSRDTASFQVDEHSPVGAKVGADNVSEEPEHVVLLLAHVIHN